MFDGQEIKVDSGIYKSIIKLNIVGLGTIESCSGIHLDLNSNFIIQKSWGYLLIRDGEYRKKLVESLSLVDFLSFRISSKFVILNREWLISIDEPINTNDLSDERLFRRVVKSAILWYFINEVICNL
jgi:hypothetical protein